MTYKIVETEKLTPVTMKLVIEAPRVAKAAEPGQFIILRAFEHSERIPLTIADSDAEKGTVTIIFQMVGKSTKEMGKLRVNDEIINFLGPLGKPTGIHKYGVCVVLGGGLGVAPTYPEIKALKAAGNKVISIMSARSADLLILEKEIRQISDEYYITTDDGSKGFHGFGITLLKKMIEEEGRNFDFCVAIGPGIMMKVVSEYTKEKNIPTMVSLAPIMIDGTGMCGGCRFTYAGETKFVCVDGPGFDGHKVDWPSINRRMGSYVYEERVASKEYDHKCKIGLENVRD